MEEEIRSEIERIGFSVDDSALPSLLTCCINYKLSAADLASNWELYYLNGQLSGSVLDSSHLDGFLLYLQNELKERTIKSETNGRVYSVNDIDMLVDKDKEHHIEGMAVDCPEFEIREMTPQAKEQISLNKAAKVESIRITPFGQRISKFTQQFVFNAHNVSNELSKQEADILEDDVVTRIQPKHQPVLQILQSLPKPGCRYMFDTLEDRFNSIENRIQKAAKLFATSGLHGVPTDATLACENNVFSVGMVICDGEGHLNEKSILLQGSVEHSRGQRVRLDLHNLKQFSLFPGQVIGIVGHNPSGHCLIASELIDSIPYSGDDSLVPPSKKQALDREDDEAIYKSRMLSSVIAVGPYTTTDNLLFEPLRELLSYCSRKHTQMLILMGPFVDSEHPDIKKGTVNQSFQDIFYNEFLRKLQDYNKFMGSTTRVVLISSVRDAHHDPIFPQPGMNLSIPENTQQIHTLPNPTLFSSNEVCFGCCTVDILKQLSGEEISRYPPDAVSTDRISRLATHLLKQHSFYPLYPPAAGVPLDLSLAPQALEISTVPDILLLPSDLAPFVKVLPIRGEVSAEQQRILCINPGRLSKGIGGGTFIELHYNGDIDRSSACVIRI